MTKKLKIGFYGGSFDPIHLGHINLAIGLKEYHQLDEIWVCPAWKSPLKEHEAINPTHRFKMTELAIQNIPGFRLLDHEVKRGGPSFTIETLLQLQEEHKEPCDFFLLLGSDALPHLHQWKEIDKLITLAPPLIGKRSCEIGPYMGSLKLQKAIEEGMTPTSVIEIDATSIRNRLKMKKYCAHLLPAKVLDYIYENQLYF